jgi:hypothetical protein
MEARLNTESKLQRGVPEQLCSRRSFAQNGAALLMVPGRCMEVAKIVECEHSPLLVDGRSDLKPARLQTDRVLTVSPRVGHPGEIAQDIREHIRETVRLSQQHRLLARGLSGVEMA